MTFSEISSRFIYFLACAHWQQLRAYYFPKETTDLTLFEYRKRNVERGSKKNLSLLQDVPKPTQMFATFVQKC